MNNFVECRSERTLVMLTPTERKALEDAAEDYGDLSISSMARIAILEFLDIKKFRK